MTMRRGPQWPFQQRAGRPPGPPDRRPPSGHDRQEPPLAGDYPLPRATAAALSRGLPSGANASLVLNKLVGPWENVRQGRIGDEQRKRFLKRCARTWESDAADGVRADMYRRWQAMLATYRASGWEVREHTAHPVWRFVSGLGMTNPLEINLVLHRMGGFPYIPGSSVKGAVRAYAELAVGATPAPADAPAEALHPDVVEVFGARDRQGKVIFFDALPATRPLLELDVINVHYPDYYRSGAAPTDWQNPTPVLFLAVSKGTRFAFAVASRSAAVAEQAMAWLHGALQTTGLGGKTAAGYGHFTAP